MIKNLLVFSSKLSFVFLLAFVFLQVMATVAMAQTTIPDQPDNNTEVNQPALRSLVQGVLNVFLKISTGGAGGIGSGSVLGASTVAKASPSPTTQTHLMWREL